MRAIRMTVGMGLLAVAALGQTPSEPVPAERPPAQRRAAGGEPGPARPTAIFERLGKQLDLDEAQRAQYDQIVAVYREKVVAQRQGQAEAAELIRKMREARQAGDDEQVRQIREQMRNRRGGAGGGEVMQRFFDDVEKILRDDQKEKLGTLRERLGAGGPRGERGPRPFVAPEQQIAQLRERLDLTEEQRSTFDALAGSLKQQLTADGQPMAGLMQQLREAYTSGDREEAARIRKAVGQRRSAVEKALGEFAAQLEPTLTEEQKGRFAEFREQALRGMGPRSAADSASLRGDPRMLLRAVKRLDLSQEQKDQVRAIESDVSKQLRSAGRDGAAGVRADLDKQLRAILTADQTKQLDEILVRQQENSGRARRDAPTGEPARPRTSPAADKP